MSERGVWLGIDPGEVRVGVAASDSEGRLAVPVETIPRAHGDVERILTLAAERGAVQIVVGLPRSLSGAEGPAAARARTFAATLASSTGLPIVLFDERLTTVTASQSLRAAGRTSRNSRGVIDQEAATVLLQAALDTADTASGTVGELVPAAVPRTKNATHAGGAER